MKNPYIKQLKTSSGFNIWIVDGKYIRDNVDEEFTNFGQHYKFNYIPENEFWLDKEASLNEYPFFIEHLLVEYRLMKQGMSYDDASELADSAEIRERKRFDKNFKASKKNTIDPENTHKELLIDNGIEIWLVNGDFVRSNFDIEFTEGGHGLVYGFIPKDEIWIDDDLTKNERAYVIIHEFFERDLMKKGMGYENAHKEASELEFDCRRHPGNEFLQSGSSVDWYR